MLGGSETTIKHGMLIDWDLSTAIDPGQGTPDAARRFTRTVSKVSEAVCLLSCQRGLPQGT